MDDNIGGRVKKLEDMGQLDNTIVVFTTDNGAEAISFPDVASRRSRAKKARPGRRLPRPDGDPLAGGHQAGYGA